MTPKWRAEFSPEADRDFKKLDPQIQRKIIHFLRRLLEDQPSPRAVGEAMSATYKGYWRYRVGDYRIICELLDNKVFVVVVGIGHRREIYR